ncbi:hypothetical protein CS542_09790 [Pedobacter sp. IW39]|nr:hypothetical protein CS542_09790 [Pedobacter sp. IW39]
MLNIPIIIFYMMDGVQAIPENCFIVQLTKGQPPVLDRRLHINRFSWLSEKKNLKRLSLFGADI